MQKQPRFMLATFGHTTYVFLDGQDISNDIRDVRYSARDENGKLNPIVTLEIYAKSFLFKGDGDVSEFLKNVEQANDRHEELKELFTKESK